MRRSFLLTVVLALGAVISSSAAAPQDSTPRFTVGTATAGRGETAYGALRVPAAADAALDMPVAVIHGAKPGPVVAFVAGSHGTEYASSVALSRLIAQVDPTKLTGTAIVMPMLNVPSFERMIVHVNPVDGKGMNSQYPGSDSGTQTQRALALISRHVVERADVIVDLHGGDLDEDLRPYSYWTRTGYAPQDDASKTLVMAFGLDHIILRDIDVANAASARSLGGYALSRGKVALVAEAGRSGQVIQADVDALINGCLNVLGALKMQDRAAKPGSAAKAVAMKPVWVTGGSRVAADGTSMFFATVARDTVVKAGDVVGYTTDMLGRRISDVKAPVAGLVTFIRGVPSTWAGATLVNISPILVEPPPYKKPS